MPRQRNTTIVDIAEAAGVSMATVSNVLNRRNVPMSEETVRRVEETAKRLGYRRNVMAASLSSRKSYELGLLVPSFGNYYGKFAETMEKAAHRAGYHVSIFSAGGFDPVMERRHLEVLLQRRVDGLFCHGLAMSPETTRTIVGDGTPLVLFNGWGWPEDIALGAVNLDFSGVCKDAVQHLVQSGCRSLVYISRPKSLATNEQRLIGYLQGISDYAGHLAHSVVEMLPDSHVKDIVDSIERNHGEAAGSIGVIAFNDMEALSIMSEAVKRGRRVPEAMKIVGINNEPVSSLCYPTITSFDIPYELQAQYAISLMLHKLDGIPLPEDMPEMETGKQLRIPMPLIRRMSTQS
jgi:LacI family transcriptional regulator